MLLEYPFANRFSCNKKTQQIFWMGRFFCICRLVGPMFDDDQDTANFSPLVVTSHPVNVVLYFGDICVGDVVFFNHEGNQHLKKRRLLYCTYIFSRLCQSINSSISTRSSQFKHVAQLAHVLRRCMCIFLQLSSFRYFRKMGKQYL